MSRAAPSTTFLTRATIRRHVVCMFKPPECGWMWGPPESTSGLRACE